MGLDPLHNRTEGGDGQLVLRREGRGSYRFRFFLGAKRDSRMDAGCTVWNAVSQSISDETLGSEGNYEKVGSLRGGKGQTCPPDVGLDLAGKFTETRILIRPF